MSYFREVVESMTGTLPSTPYPNCRCPESHPRISTKNPFYCMKNGAFTNKLVGRLSPQSHPPEYLVNGEVINYWLSEQVNQVTLEVDLKYSRLQVCLL